MSRGPYDYTGGLPVSTNTLPAGAPTFRGRRKRAVYYTRTEEPSPREARRQQRKLRQFEGWQRRSASRAARRDVGAPGDPEELPPMTDAELGAAVNDYSGQLDAIDARNEAARAGGAIGVAVMVAAALYLVGGK